MHKIIPAFVLLLSICASGQQPNYLLHFKNGKFLPAENIQQIINNPSELLKASHEGKIYAVMQFYSVPGETSLRSLQSAGIQLMDYMPKYAYTVSVPAGFNFATLDRELIRSLFILPLKYKIDESLNEGNIPSYAQKKSGYADVSVMFFDAGGLTAMEKYAASMGITVLSSSPEFRLMTLRVGLNSIDDLASLPYVQWVEAVTPPVVPENLPGKTLHRSNVLNDGARNLTGSGIRIGEWDGGSVGPHVDFSGRLTVVQNVPSSDHATHVAGTMAGAGLIDPYARGMAPAASVYSYDFNGNINSEVLSAISTYNILMTQNSYGYGNDFVDCVERDPYNSNSFSQDVNIVNHPHLVHVHSAGNSQSVCSGGWGTTTGKAAKNILVVANVSSTEGISGSSSFGPVQDGRLKPEISALGTSVYSTTPNNTYTGGYSGTSMATPGVSGTIAQLYERYKQLNSGNNPPASLMKALACNTARDLGNAGPDYKHGFGRINGLLAVRALETNRYQVNSITHNDTNGIQISIPAGAVRLKVMLCWTDPAGAINANPALVNDLDLTVKDPSSATWLPWILNAASPGSVATRGIDTLNNIEQVTIDNPAAGTYTLIVDGSLIPSGSQLYAITWEIEQPYIEVTFPNGNEKLIPGSSHTITWDNAGITGNQTVQYSLNNGSSWTTISSTVGASTTRRTWTVPSGGFTKDAKVRVFSGSITDESDATFTVMGTPGSLSVSSDCGPAGSVDISWNSVANASHYEVLNLDTVNGVWNVIANNLTTLTYQATGLTPGIRYWFTVIAKNNAAGISGERAIAKSAVASSASTPPPQPGAISGVTSVCSGATGVTYSIAPVGGAIDYIWTVPSGATITSGQGSFSITVTFGNSSGNITVTASNTCGSGSPSVLAVTVSTISQPSAISGEQDPCVNETGVVYSIPSVPGATTYTWSVPGDATILSGQGSTSITVGFGVLGGEVSVTASNGTCFSPVRNLNIALMPAPQTPVITASGSTVLCAGESVDLSVSFNAPSCGITGVCNGEALQFQSGTGSSSNSSTSYPTAYGNYYESSRHQFLVRASELTAAGIQPGSITSVAFNVASLNNTGVHREFTIKLACTSEPELDDFIPGAQTVYGPLSYTPVTGTNTHEFHTPFTWDGISNVVVEVCHNNDLGSSSQWTANASVRYTTTSFTSVAWMRDDNSGSMCSYPQVYSTSSGRPNMTFSACGTGNLSYLWNPSAGLDLPTSQSVTASPSVTTAYVVTVTNDNGCSASSSPFTVTVDPCGTDLSVDLLLDGYCTGGGLMNNLLYDIGLSANPLATDSVTIMLYNVSNLSVAAYSEKAIVNTSGHAEVNIDVADGSYYIVIDHRNSLQTWSSAPISFSGNAVSYSFSSSASSAYGNNLRDLGNGNFAIFCGDINRDGIINLADMQMIENETDNFLNGYLPEDITGNGSVESDDYSVVGNNFGKTISRP